jgi:hypothetical protein
MFGRLVWLSGGIVGWTILFLGSAPVWGQTSFPMITHTHPTAVTRGSTQEVTVYANGGSFAEALAVHIEGDGVTAEVVPDKNAPKGATNAPVPVVRQLTLRVTVAADAPLGVREFRIRTAHGISSLGQLLIVDDPVVVENGSNSTPDKAQTVPIPAVICGRIDRPESVDYYTFPAKAGQTLTFEVHCARLQDKIHDLQKHADPLLSIADTSGRELASSDDDRFADPMLVFTPPADGLYRLAIRDAKYDGDPRWSYAVTITDRPYVKQIFPIGVPPSATVVFEPVLSIPQRPQWSATTPASPGLHSISLRPPGSSRPTNPVPLVVSNVPIQREQEPNDTPAQANPLPVPGGVNGRIGQRRDLDYYRLALKKGQTVVLEVFARRFGTELTSRLDALLEVLSADGQNVLASNDDQSPAMKDSLIVFTAPADGDYLVRLRDLNNKGSEEHVYFLLCELARPDFSLKVDPSIAMIGPGSSTAWYVQVTRRHGFAGPVTVTVEGLPAGVQVNPLTIPANMTQGVLVLTATGNAPLGGGPVRVLGTATIEHNGQKETLQRVATAVEEIYFPGGGRGRFDVRMQAVAVTQTSDILRVQVQPQRITLKPGQEVTLSVTVERSPRYAGKPVTLDVFLRHLGAVYGNPLPPGVTLVEGKSKTLLGTGDQGTITLRAAPDAPPCTDVPIAVQAFVPINFVVKIGYASAPILLTVEK